MTWKQEPLNFEQPAPLPQVSIFSGEPVTGAELKQEGIDRTMRKKASRQYRDRLIEALKVFPVRSRITIEQLTGIVGRPPEGVSVNAVGAIVNGMAKKGLISKTGKMPTAGRKERHGGQVSEWEVLKYS